MQNFLGYSSFTSEPPFDLSLFVEFHKRLGMDNLNAYPDIQLDNKIHKYLLVINTVYEQQKKMYNSLSHSVEDRIVSFHQPYEGWKSQAKGEFGAKIHVAIIDGISYLRC